MSETLTSRETANLIDFARTCKAAARAVALYPSTHPAIESAINRILAAASRLSSNRDFTLAVHPDTVHVDGRPAIRTDAAIGELATLLHERAIGSLRIGREAGAQDWLALLLLLGKPPEDVLGDGGIRQAWTATGRRHVDIQEIDYAEVLRERQHGEAVDWTRIVAQYLDAHAGSISERIARLLELLRQDEGDAVIEALGALAPQVPADLIVAMIASSVVAEHGATERLAQAFQALVPEHDQRMRVLELAREQLAQTALGSEEGFEELWQATASMLATYSDRPFVPPAYAKELSDARAQAVEVERVSDDPPERVDAWLATVSDGAVRDLDLALLLDLLRLETDPIHWQDVADVAVAEVERRTARGEIAAALQLVEGIGDRGDTLDRLARGPLVGHMVTYLRKAEEQALEPLKRLCHAIGARIARPLAEALAVETHNLAIRRLRELLLGFGAAGRQSVERLKNSANPAIRRMAIDLLRVFGGHEALPELASMLGDADPHVQREAIRAIVQIGTDEAFAVLERSLVAGGRSRQTVVQELVSLRDDKAIPLFCYVLNHTTPRGALVEMHVQIIDALGWLSGHHESTRTLRDVLHRGEWWAPTRTARLRSAAAAALRRIGSDETVRVLEDAAASGSRGVRSAARAQLGAVAQERVPS